MPVDEAPSSWPLPVDLMPLWQTRHDDGKARAALVLHYLPYARMHAARLYAGRFGDDLEFGDYFQFATVALTEAVDTYDPDKEVRFETYAAYRIRGAVLDGIGAMSERMRQIAVTRELRQARLKSLLSVDAPESDGSGASAKPPESLPASSRQPLFPQGSALERLSDLGLGLALGLMLEGTGMVDAGLDAPAPAVQQPYARLEMRQQRERLLRLLQQLPEPQRLVMQWHYLQGLSFESHANRMGLSKGRVSQLHRAALATLRRWMEEDG